MATGWPTDEELAAYLGPHVDATEDLVAQANEAARADAIRYAPAAILDPDAGALDADTFHDVLDLGAWRYNSRNKGPDYVAAGEYGPNAADRLRILGRLQARQLPVA